MTKGTTMSLIGVIPLVLLYVKYIDNIGRMIRVFNKPVAVPKNELAATVKGCMYTSILIGAVLLCNPGAEYALGVAKLLWFHQILVIAILLLIRISDKTNVVVRVDCMSVAAVYAGRVRFQMASQQLFSLGLEFAAIIGVGYLLIA